MTIVAAVRGWVVVQTKAQRELYAAENLARQEYEHYLPRILVFQPKHHRVVSEPLFRSYIFVKVIDRWLPLLSTYGVQKLIMQGSGPAVVAQDEIDKLRARHDADGYVKLEKAPSRFSLGDKVCISEGLYAGREGIYDGTAARDRVRILMDYLGRKSRVLISEALLEPVSPRVS